MLIQAPASIRKAARKKARKIKKEGRASATKVRKSNRAETKATRTKIRSSKRAARNTKRVKRLEKSITKQTAKKQLTRNAVPINQANKTARLKKLNARIAKKKKSSTKKNYTTKISGR